MIFKKTKMPPARRAALLKDRAQTYCAENGMRIVHGKELEILENIPSTIEYICREVPEYSAEVSLAFTEYAQGIRNKTVQHLENNSLTYGERFKEYIEDFLDDRKLLSNVYTIEPREKEPDSYARKIVAHILKACEKRKQSLLEQGKTPADKLLAPDDIADIINKIYDTTGVGVFTKKGENSDKKSKQTMNALFSMRGFVVCEHVQQRKDRITEAHYGYENIEYLSAAFGKAFPSKEIKEMYNNPDHSWKWTAEETIEDFIRTHGTKRTLSKLKALKKASFSIDPKTGRIARIETKDNPTGYISDIINVIDRKGRRGEFRVIDFMEYDIGKLEHKFFNFGKGYFNDVTITEDSHLINHAEKFAYDNFFADKTSPDGETKHRTKDEIKKSRKDIQKCTKKAKAFIRELIKYIPDTDTYVNGIYHGRSVGERVKDVYSMCLLYELVESTTNAPIFHNQKTFASYDHFKGLIPSMEPFALDSAVTLIGSDNAAMPQQPDLSSIRIH